MLRFLFLLLSLQLFALTGAQAKSHDYILDRAYFEDTTNSLTFADAQHQPFTPYKGLLNRGFSHSTFWVRLNIGPVSDPQDTALQNLVLRILPTYLNTIELFDPLVQAEKPRVVGDRHPLVNNEYQSLSFNFVVPSSQTPRYVWLRLKTTSTNLMQVRALDLKDTKQADQIFDILAIGGSVMLIIFLIWSGLHWLLFREQLVGIFFVRQTVSIFFFASYMGYLRIFLSYTFTPGQLDYTFSFFVIATSLASIWFHVEFFKDYQIHRYVRYSLNAGIALFPIELILMMLGYIIPALAMNMVMILIMPMYFLCIVFFLIPWHQLPNEGFHLPKKPLIFFHTIYVLITATAAIPALGFPALTEMAPFIVLLHGVVTGLLLLVMILYRSKRAQQNSLLQVVIAKHEAINQKSRREEQGHFLEMLTHEFKTSLAVLRLSLAKVSMGSKEAQYADQAIINMNEVIERCGQAQALDDEQLQIEKTEVDLVAMLHDLTHSHRELHRIHLHVVQPKITVTSDARLLKIIFSNLLDNACKYSKANTNINVSVAVQSGQVSIKFENQVGSAGLPDEAMVFKKYYRSPKAHQQVGSGLGLYLTNQMARMLGAKMLYVPITYIPSNRKVSFELCLIESK